MILNHLKAATHSRHAALESRLPLLDAHLARSAYREFVHLFFGYYEPLEETLLAQPCWESIGFDYAERRKTPRLRQDLLALGDSAASLDRLARCQSLPPLASPAQVLGCLYVIEGATLGGQIISRRLASGLGLDATSGAAFFSGYGPQTGSRWKAFCAMLESQAEQHGHHQDMVDSARQTFETLGHWLFPKYPVFAAGSP
ncbi:MAG: biliverdin-producing heme oxygenase [Polaromonas sp.]|nr:biliverdin-producing heme oxygenase [Polaromonas sp.]